MYARSLKVISRGLASPVQRGLVSQQFRSIVVYRGAKTKGALRNPEEYLTSGNRKHEVSEDNLKHIKGYVSSISGGKYQLPDKLLLQVVTHKSFAHGKVPYNEKLSILGSNLYRMTTAKFAVHLAEQSEQNTHSLPVDSFNSAGFRILNGDLLVKAFADATGLAKTVFWKNPEPLKSSEQINEKVERTTVFALIGAIVAQHGTRTAEEFIINEMIQQAVNSEVFQKEQEAIP